MNSGFLEVSYTQWKSFVSRPSISTYYTVVDGTPSIAVAIDPRFIYVTFLTDPADSSDFSDNYQDDAEEVDTIDEAIGIANSQNTVTLFDGSGNAISSTDGNLIVAQQIGPTISASEGVWQFSTVVTTTTAADQTVVTYTVPALKTFYLLFFEIAKATVNNINGDPCKLFANGEEHARCSLPGGTNSAIVWNTSYAAGYPIATAGQIVKLTVTPSGTTATTWQGRLVGMVK